MRAVAPFVVFVCGIEINSPSITSLAVNIICIDLFSIELQPNSILTDIARCHGDSGDKRNLRPSSALSSHSIGLSILRGRRITCTTQIAGIINWDAGLEAQVNDYDQCLYSILLSNMKTKNESNVLL